ncbi:MAG: beta 1-4 rhamnosyltransferase Cps2T [Clostridiaceae bacterium]
MRHIFIIGSKGIPAKYGGFETFVEKLTEKKVSENIKYHVACMADNNDEFVFNNARCFNVSVPSVGSAKAVLYDVFALKKCAEYIKEHKIEDAVIYILACRIGPFLNYYKGYLKKLNIKVYVNPDGHEWKRSKWNNAIKAYWKYSEKLMIKNADLAICDSKGIEKYINEEYRVYKPKTTFIAYGADITRSKLDSNDDKSVQWYNKHGVKTNEFYLIVGRFVPENNYETAIREFMKSDTKKDLVIITNIEKNKFYQSLKENTVFEKDSRIKFVGTVYDEELLKKIREDAFGYIHGHEVGGTNPSLLEALASTKLNLLLDVNFNKEVAENSARYFSKDDKNLANLINSLESIDNETLSNLDKLSTERIENHYSWGKIVNDYEELFNRS